MNAPLILDRRGHMERRVLRCWKSWGASPPAWVRCLDSVIAAPRKALMARRVAGRIPPPRDRLVVSIGNLRVGGTGKTPLVIDLAQELARRGVAGAILTRGYGSSLKDPRVVEHADEVCADEARLMAREQPWPVIQAADRLSGYELARRHTVEGDVILLEDAHQTAHIGRHHDLLLLDDWIQTEDGVQPRTCATLPLGPYREGVEGATRASAWILTVANSESRPDLVSGVPVLAMTRRSVLSADTLAESGAYGLISGLARPERFEAACAQEMGRPAAVVGRFSDHVRYGESDLEAVIHAGDKRGVVRWLTTAKDHGKLASLWPGESRLEEVELALNWVGRCPADLVEDWLKD